jgi:hypothetical protein
MGQGDRIARVLSERGTGRSPKDQGSEDQEEGCQAGKERAAHA